MTLCIIMHNYSNFNFILIQTEYTLLESIFQPDLNYANKNISLSLFVAISGHLLHFEGGHTANV